MEKDTREIWQWIRWWMIHLGISPAELARLINYPKDRIERGLNGELVPIKHKLFDLVYAFNPPNARGRFFEEEYDTLTEEEIISMLKPPAPRQGNLWSDYTGND